MSSQLSPSASIPRRSFLKLSAFGLLGLVWPRSARLQVPLGDQIGRVIAPKISLYRQPSYTSQEVGEFSRDSLVTISHVTVGDHQPEYNRVWYRIGSQGYVHSGMVQPVQVQLNEPQAEFKNGPRLAEVTVPFTDAHYRPGEGYEIAYRFYYETTHWVDRLLEDRVGGLWYRVREDKWELIYYVQAAHLRVIPEQELQPSAPQVPEGAKRIEINLEKQIVVAYEWERPVFMSRIASGAKFSNGTFSTPAGTHMTYHKRPSRHMAAGNLAANGYDLPGVPWVSYFTERGVAFHGTYWHNDYGRPRSHGCVNMSSQAARWIYLWTNPPVPPQEERLYEKTGTRVDVFAPEAG